MTATAAGLTAEDLRDLLGSWLVQLEAERKAEATPNSYRLGVEQYLDHCAATGVEADLSRHSLATFVNALLDGGKSASTAVLRQFAVRRFSAWLAEEGEIERDELLGVKPPKKAERVVYGLDDDQLRRWSPPAAASASSTDEALIRLLAETGLRAAEVLGLTLDRLDVRGRKALVTGTYGSGGASARPTGGRSSSATAASGSATRRCSR